MRRQKAEIARADGVHVWDTTGKRYLDGSSGAMVVNIGHSNASVLAAMRAQMDRATFAMRMHFECEAAERLAAKTAARAPKGLSKVFYTSGGSEAVESAIKLARNHALARGEAERWKVISRFPAYHGCTLGALAVTGYAPMTAPYAPLMREMPKIPAPRAYLDGLDPTDPATGHHYAAMLEDKILAEGPGTVLAFLVEPVGGASTGALVPPAGYLQEIRAICDRHGVLLIHDEVVSGGGRVGTFFAGDLWGVTPDLITVSKGFGGGYVALGAVIAKDEIVDAVMDAGGFPHGFTYGGNPLACAAGIAVMDEIDRHNLMENANKIGATLKTRMTGLMNRHALIGDVRGTGLLLAFELVSDRATLAPLPAALNAYDTFVETAYANGLIVYARRTRGGHTGDHFVVAPPLITTEADVDELIEKLDASLTAFSAANGLP
ncbi:MAG: aspartate aminotransferase family protein [Pseudomonadota bacterium]